MKTAHVFLFVAFGVACSPAPQRAPAKAAAVPTAPSASVAPTATASATASPDVLQDYEHVALTELHVDSGVAESSIDVEASAGGHRVLRVRYACPPGRDCDIWQKLGSADWRGARALQFRIRTDKPIALSTSFIDGNGVGYTVHTDMTRGGDWETLEVPFDRYRPNQYFQPPDAKVGSPLDLEHVRAFGFCPLDAGPGSFEIDDVSLAR